MLVPFRTAAALAAAAGLLVAAGCGDNRSAVSGRVSLDGKPVEAGTISFVPEATTKGPSAGATIANGEYRVEGENLPVPGSYRVEITATKKTGKMIPAGSPAPKGTMVEETVQAVPEKYNKKSTLQKDLKAGSNSLDFDLTTAGN